MIKERLLQTFIELCKRESESLNERMVADYVIEYLNNIGVKVEEDKAGNKIGGNTGNLVFELPGKKNGRILFSAHIDTVVPGTNVKPIVNENEITSDGTTILGADDKAGVAILLECIQTLMEENAETPTLVIVLSVAEEIGLLGVQNLEKEIKADYGYVLDSNGAPGTIVREAPVHYKYRAVISGKASHAGLAPENGINAIKIAGEAIAKIRLGRIDEETTSNIGTILGGVATNIVPEEVEIEGEIRSFNQEKAEKLLIETQEVFLQSTLENGGSLSFKEHMEYVNFRISSKEEVIQRAVKVIKSLDLEPVIKSAGGGSDGNIYNKKGIPAVILGLGYENVHTKREYITKENLQKSMEIVLGLMRG